MRGAIALNIRALSTGRVFMTTSIDLLPHEIYQAYLKEINETEFSLRELEIIASLFISDTIKQSPDVIPLIEEDSKESLAYTYKIASGTVFNHISKICGKLQESAKTVGILVPNKTRKGDVIKYIVEQSDVFPHFERYCAALRREAAFLMVIDRLFKQCVDDIKRKEPTRSGIGRCHIYVDSLDSRVPSLYKQLARYLNDRKDEGQPKILTTVIKEGSFGKGLDDKIDYIIYVLPDTSNGMFASCAHSVSPIITTIEERLLCMPGSVIFILDQWKTKNVIPSFVEKAGYVLIDEHMHPYQLTVDILTCMFPAVSLDTHIMDCQQTFLKQERAQSFFQNMKWLVGVGLFFLTSLLFLAIHNQTIDSLHVVARSDIKVPTDTLLLKRLPLIRQMNAQLMTHNTIQPLALTGVGGAGKTVLARLYARTYAHAVVWEINAETKTTLVDSFMALAMTLAQTKEEKEAVSGIKALPHEKEKEQQLMVFVRKHLKTHENWLLIYDNAESFAEITPFFPYDATIWGKGHVIITTRDQNIVNSQYMGEANTIHINPLTEDEALALFSYIFYQKESHALSTYDKNNACSLLKNIPPFPLDVVVAAHYIKNVALTFDQYSAYILQNSQAFIQSQYRMLKEIGDYTQPRYGLVTASLHTLLDINPDYANLLFLMCFIDSHQIPLDFLRFYKDPLLVDLFIRDMKKFSFITDERDGNHALPTRTFSLHRSLQTLTQQFLREHLPLEMQTALLDAYVKAIKAYYDTHVYKENGKISATLIHLEAFLKNIDTLRLDNMDHNKQILYYVLGHSYYHANRHFVKEKEYFEKAYQLQEKTKALSSFDVASMLKLLSYVCLELNLRNEAIAYAEKSLQICDSLPHSEILKSSILKVIGFAYLQENKFDQSNHAFEKALQTIASLDQEVRRDSESSIYSYMGLLYSMTYLKGDKAQKGLTYAHKALELVEGTPLFYQTALPEKPLSCRVVEHKVNLGEIHCLMGKYNEAYERYFKDVDFIIQHTLDQCPHAISHVIARIGTGEYYLRTNQLALAKQCLTELFKETEKLIGKKNSFITKLAVFRAETCIRLGELDQAYADCLLAFNEEKESQTHYLASVSLMAHYHAAVICYRQGKLRESCQHFTDFFKKAKRLYALILEPHVYQKLENDHTFEMLNDHRIPLLTVVKQYFHQSCVLFSAVYGDDHPFVRDYVLVNQRGLRT